MGEPSLGQKRRDQSVVELALPVLALGKEPLPPPPRPPPPPVESPCAVCSETVAGFAVESATLSGSHLEIDFFKNVRGRTCQNCQAVFCSRKHFHRKVLKWGFFNFDSGRCSCCGQPLEGAGYVLPSATPMGVGSDDYFQWEWSPSGPVFPSFTLEASDALIWPPRCIVCGSSELAEPMEIAVEFKSVAANNIVQTNPWKSDVYGVGRRNIRGSWSRIAADTYQQTMELVDGSIRSGRAPERTLSMD